MAARTEGMAGVGGAVGREIRVHRIIIMAEEDLIVVMVEAVIVVAGMEGIKEMKKYE